jgi:6,7-dimethyl-8-ribityllumazine synthase
MTEKFEVVLKKIIDCVTKQSIKIKITIYFCLITKAAMRQHVNICFAAL